MFADALFFLTRPFEMATGVQPAIGGLALSICPMDFWYIRITVDLSTSIFEYILKEFYLVGSKP